MNIVLFCEDNRMLARLYDEHGLLCQTIEPYDIDGIPKAIINNPIFLQKFLHNTWTKLIPLNDGSFRLSIHPKMHGGNKFWALAASACFVGLGVCTGGTSIVLSAAFLGAGLDGAIYAWKTEDTPDQKFSTTKFLTRSAGGAISGVLAASGGAAGIATKNLFVGVAKGGAYNAVGRGLKGALNGETVMSKEFVKQEIVPAFILGALCTGAGRYFKSDSADSLTKSNKSIPETNTITQVGENSQELTNQVLQENANIITSAQTTPMAPIGQTEFISNTVPQNIAVNGLGNEIAKTTLVEVGKEAIKQNTTTAEIGKKIGISLVGAVSNTAIKVGMNKCNDKPLTEGIIEAATDGAVKGFFTDASPIVLPYIKNNAEKISGALFATSLNCIAKCVEIDQQQAENHTQANIHNNNNVLHRHIEQAQQVVIQRDFLQQLNLGLNRKLNAANNQNHALSIQLANLNNNQHHEELPTSPSNNI